MEPPSPLKNIRSRRGDAATARGFGEVGSGRGKERHCYFRKTAAVDLLRQRSPAVGDDGASEGLEQDAVLVRYLDPQV